VIKIDFMEGQLSIQTSIRGVVNEKIKCRCSKYGIQQVIAPQTIAFLLIGFYIASSNGMPHRIPTDIFYNHEGSKMELLLSPEDTLTMLDLLTTLDQRQKLQKDLEISRQQKKYEINQQEGLKTMKRNNGVKKLSNSQINPKGNIDYDDFPEVVPFLEAVSNHNLGIYKAPKKRYLGIDIPDYISSGGNPEAIKNMSSKLKALGKRRRR